MHPHTPPVSNMSFANNLPVFDHFDLSGYNLATHITDSEQQGLPRKYTDLADDTLTVFPPTVCGKRSRSNSDVSSSSSSDARSLSNSVFSTEFSYDSPTSTVQTVCSRKPSLGQEGEQQLDTLAAWRADVLSQHQTERLSKRVKALHSGEDSTDGPTTVAPSVTICPTLAAPATTEHAYAAPVTLAATRRISPTSSPTPECKNTYVDCLVDTACQTLDKIWKASSSSFACDLGEAKTGLPLQVFVRETLRRGRATCSVLQAALLYCARLGDAMRQLDCPLVGPTPDLSNVSAALGVAKEDICFLRCPRRMFLASILISSKFLQDKTYSNRAWAKLSGLNVKDLGRIERAFLKAIDYRLVVSDGEWEAWNAESKRTRSSSACNASGPSAGLIRTQSDNVSGAAAPYDTELRAASPRVASQVAHKYRPVAEHTPQQIVAGNAASSDMCLPHPMAVRVLSV